MPKGSSHRLRKPGALHWVLAWVVVAQAAVPLQAHTKLAAADSGRVMVLCTWSGTRTIAIGGPEAPHGDTPERLSPACLFSQLLYSADVATDEPPSVSMFVSVSTRSTDAASQVRPEARRSPAIRGPPSGPVPT